MQQPDSWVQTHLSALFYIHLQSAQMSIGKQRITLSKYDELCWRFLVIIITS